MEIQPQSQQATQAIDRSSSTSHTSEQTQGSFGDYQVQQSDQHHKLSDSNPTSTAEQTSSTDNISWDVINTRSRSTTIVAPERDENGVPEDFVAAWKHLPIRDDMMTSVYNDEIEQACDVEVFNITQQLVDNPGLFSDNIDHDFKDSLSTLMNLTDIQAAIKNGDANDHSGSEKFVNSAVTKSLIDNTTTIPGTKNKLEIFAQQNGGTKTNALGQARTLLGINDTADPAVKTLTLILTTMCTADIAKK